ncbi:MAG: hypothetical protein GY694_13575 [Gammaproteobacteria bacterium]|nr:hypothetical protein [Gammaproteobacteria bacterium]
MNMLTQMRSNQRVDSERRIQDRRRVNYVFNSSKWIKNIKNHYVAWPKVDRRQNIRRDGERRYVIKQQDVIGSQHYNLYNNDYSSDLLTKEERLYFDELFLNNS